MCMERDQGDIATDLVSIDMVLEMIRWQLGIIVEKLLVLGFLIGVRTARGRLFAGEW